METEAESTITEQDSGTADLLVDLLNTADQVLVKKLSTNDRSWSWGQSKQNGVYISRILGESGFFPPFTYRMSTEGNEIRECLFHTFWPQADDVRESRLAFYSSKGEAHFTRLPKELFVLPPASFLVIGRYYHRHAEHPFTCMTISSGSEEVVVLETFLDLDPEFDCSIFNPHEIKARETDLVLDFAEMVIRAWLDGTIEELAAAERMPTTQLLARMARDQFVGERGLPDLSPFRLDAPGDALLTISRGIEWELFRRFQRQERAIALVRLLLGDRPRPMDATSIIRRLVEELPSIDALMLSASQQRKVRAGRSYEHHLEAMMLDGGIPFEKQVILRTGSRPDFVLPSLQYADHYTDGPASGLILSAKTTLRERWKQVEREKGDRSLYLATLDDNIPGSVVDELADFGACLVVPEALLTAKKDVTEYRGHGNVLSFRSFCHDVLRPRLSRWLAA